MLAKCANPRCAKPFLYIHEGRLFRLGPAQSNGQGSTQLGEWFWFCDRCAPVARLAKVRGEVVAMSSRCDPEPTQGAEGNLCLRPAC